MENELVLEKSNVVYRQVFGKAGVAYADSIGGLFSLRLWYTDQHFGNPFTHVGSNAQGCVQEFDTVREARMAYYTWLTTKQFDDMYPELLERKAWINKEIASGKWKGKPIVYYKRLGELSHADMLDYLINK